MANNDAIGGLLNRLSKGLPSRGVIGSRLPPGGVIGSRLPRQRMSDLAELQALANPRDIADIEALVKLLPELTAADREKAIEKVRKRIGVESVPLLNYYIQRAGEAPPLTQETWQIRGERAPEAARTRLEQLRMGTQPGFEHELGLGQLPEDERMAEFARRFERAEPRYPGITEVGRGMIPTGAEGVLSPTEATRRRAREAGEWPGITAITGEWKPEMFPWQKEKTISAALAKGTLTERQHKAAMTFIDYTDVPAYASNLTDEQLPAFGLSRDKQGRLQNDLADPLKETGKNLTQKTLREIFSLGPEALPRWDEYDASEQAKMRLAAFGIRMLNEGDKNRVKGGKSDFSPDFVTVIEHPLTDYKGTDQYLDAIMSLILFFDVGQIATILTLVENPEIAGGLERLIDLDTAQKR
ncbi:hypothetical protein ES702_01317 [subsurface metagenome]